MSEVFIAFQANEESRPVIDAIVADNPGRGAQPSDRAGQDQRARRLTIRRETIEDLTGRPFDLQPIHVNLVTLSGHIDEDDDQLTLSWKH